MPLSRSDILTLARRFNAGLHKPLSRVALATIEFIRRYATGNISIAHRGLKPTAKVKLPLRGKESEFANSIRDARAPSTSSRGCSQQIECLFLLRVIHKPLPRFDILYPGC
jgi:hypothetical protein